MSDELVPAFGVDGQAFEGLGQQNGNRFWYASTFRLMLGYESEHGFEQAINRAIATCTTLKLPVMENFSQCVRETADGPVQDYKLSRFACYLVAMNGDTRKPAVAAAQAYFATLAEAQRQFMQAADQVERVQIRDEITERNKSLMSTAKQAGVSDFALFHDAGYMGMYNMHLNKLKDAKRLPDGRTLLDFMDKRELAANLFRFTETDERIKSGRVFGQRPAQDVAFKVGREVRKIMMDDGGVAPERIPLAGDIKGVQKTLKQTEKEFVKLDKPLSKKKLPPSD